MSVVPSVIPLPLDVAQKLLFESFCTQESGRRCGVFLTSRTSVATLVKVLTLSLFKALEYSVVHSYLLPFHWPMTEGKRDSGFWIAFAFASRIMSERHHYFSIRKSIRINVGDNPATNSFIGIISGQSAVA